jgi:SPP1 family predicted phage head-tail adaptor
MKSGKLDRRIQIQQRVETQDSYGQAVISYSTIATVWAEVIPLSGRELFAAAQKYPEATMRIRVRFRTDVTEKHRIVFNSTNYDIIHIAEIGRNEGLEFIVKKPD